MLSYLSRKVEKFQQHYPKASQEINGVCETCESINKALEDEWNQYLKTQQTNSKINMEEFKDFSFSSDTSNPLAKARPVLQAALGTDLFLQKMRESARRPPLPTVPVHISYSSILSNTDLSAIFKQLIEAAEKSSSTKNEMELESVLQVTLEMHQALVALL